MPRSRSETALTGAPGRFQTGVAFRPSRTRSMIRDLEPSRVRAGEDHGRVVRAHRRSAGCGACHGILHLSRNQLHARVEHAKIERGDASSRRAFRRPDQEKQHVVLKPPSRRANMTVPFAHGARLIERTICGNARVHVIDLRRRRRDAGAPTRCRGHGIAARPHPGQPHGWSSVFNAPVFVPSSRGLYQI